MSDQTYAERVRMLVNRAEGRLSRKAQMYAEHSNEQQDGGLHLNPYIAARSDFGTALDLALRHARAEGAVAALEHERHSCSPDESAHKRVAATDELRKIEAEIDAQTGGE